MNHPDQETLSAMMDGEWQTSDARGAIVDVCRDDALRACWGRYHLARDAMHVEPLEVRGSVAECVARALADEPAYTNVTAIGGASTAEPGTGSAPTASLPTDDELDAADEGATAASDVGTPSSVGTPVTVMPAAEVSDTAAGTGSTRGAALRTFAAGFGLAASVALVTTVGLNVWRSGPTGASDTSSATASRVASSDGATDAAPAVDVASSTPTDAFSRQIPGAPLPEVELVANTGAYWSASDSSARRPDSEERLNMLLSRHIEESPTAERQGMLPYSRLVGYEERPEAR